MPDLTCGRNVYRTVRYRRTLEASAEHAFAALTETVDLFGYALTETHPHRKMVRFYALGRTVTASIVDPGDERCGVVVAFRSLSWMGIGGSAVVILPGVLLGAAVKAHDAWSAFGFLANVRRVLEGKGVGWDPATFPGMTALRAKLGLEIEREMEPFER